MHQAISFLVGDGDDSWVCTAVYASPTPIVRSSFWSYLVELRSRVSKPWMLIGDFNEVLLASECKGGSFVHSRARLFQDCLNACNLSDVKVVGSGFTWQRSRHGQPTILKKLDRVVADMGWRLRFPEAFVEVLPRIYSDHNPLFLRCTGLPAPRGQRPFWFEAAWVAHDDFHGVVGNAWRRDSPNVVNSLDGVRIDSLIFNKEVFGDIFRRKRLLEARIAGIQRSLEELHSESLVRLEGELQREYNQVLL